MNSMVRNCIVVLVVLGIAGCAFNQSNVSRFHKLDSSHSQATVTVLPANKTIAGSIEYSIYKEKLESHLTSQGFRVVSPNSNIKAQLTALLNYGIDTGNIVTEAYSIPVWGQTGISSSYTSGSVQMYGNYGSISATTHYMPTYGITGYNTGTVSNTVYTRVLQLDIFDTHPDPASPRKIYESKVVSKGACSTINLVVDEMLAAMFKNFRGVSGGSERVTVEVPYEKYRSCF